MDIDGNALVVFGATVGASVVAAILAGRWSRADKQSGELIEVKIGLRAIRHRLRALEREHRLFRMRYHKMRELLIRIAGVVKYKLRREDLEDDFDDNGHDDDEDDED